MTLGEIYQFVINRGIEVDPRGKESVRKSLERAKKRFEGLKEEEKKEFDRESLTNPYSDTRILHGDKGKKIRTILLGIDMEVGEVLLADRLKQKGRSIDLIMTHHPEGKALANFYEVMHMQADILGKFGVPITVAEGLLSERIQEVARRVMPINHTRAVDAARLLDIPFMTCHTPADNHVTTFLQSAMDKQKPYTVGDVVKILKGIPEYQEAINTNAGPRIVRGQAERRAGKVFVEMTGGTEGAKNIFPKLSNAGVGTIVCMHLSEEHLKKIEEEQINVVIAGHISSDNLGLNLLLDKIEKKDKFEIIPCSGFRRFRRLTRK